MSILNLKSALKSFEEKSAAMSLSMKMFFVFTCVCAIALAVLKPAYSVYIDGRRVAVVADKKTFETILEKTNAEIFELAGKNSVISEKPQYLFGMIPQGMYTSEKQITDNLMNIPGNIVKSCEISADGTVIAYAENEQNAEKVLKQAVESYGGYDKNLLTDIKYKEKYILNFNLYTDSGLYNTFKNNITVESKEKIKNETETPFEVITRENPEVKKGQTSVISEGIPGKDIVETVYTLINGIRERKTVISRTVLSASVPEILEIGTKELTGTGSGKLIKPVSGGRISSDFGARGGRRTAHKGVDIACVSGTPVAAADDGICITAEYRSDYGNLIIIDHQNGYKTYYAHLNSINTNVNDVIEKGQIIGETGNTGISTGPHIHFEVRKNDVPCNPSEFVILTE